MRGGIAGRWRVVAGGQRGGRAAKQGTTGKKAHGEEGVVVATHAEPKVAQPPVLREGDA